MCCARSWCCRCSIGGLASRRVPTDVACACMLRGSTKFAPLAAPQVVMSCSRMRDRMHRRLLQPCTRAR
eukprot:1160218-Pelagomonas_calceolata.AAC.5